MSDDPEEQTGQRAGNLPDTSDNFTFAPLTPIQARAVGVLLSCRTMKDAAKKLKVSERTLYTWLKDERFSAALEDACRKAIDHTARRLADGQSKALDALMEVIESSENDWTRRAAAVDWLNLTMKYRDVGEIERRLAELEREIYGSSEQQTEKASDKDQRPQTESP